MLDHRRGLDAVSSGCRPSCREGWDPHLGNREERVEARPPKRGIAVTSPEILSTVAFAFDSPSVVPVPKVQLCVAHRLGRGPLEQH